MNPQTDNFKIIGAIIVCSILVFIGILFREQHKVMSYLNIGFFGIGIIALTIQLLTNLRSMSFSDERDVKFPTQIEIEQVTPSDNEILEEWLRVSVKDFDRGLDLHGVYASKVDDAEFPWYVSFGAGEFIREEPFASTLYEAVGNAIEKVEGVRKTYHEDTEKFIVAGSPSGYDLVYSVSDAIDNYMINHKLNWLNQFFYKT